MTVSSSGASQPKQSSDSREFHLAEYAGLRAEILDHGGSLVTTAQYTVAASAGICVFLVTLSPDKLVELRSPALLLVATILPSVFVAFGYMLNWQKHKHIDLIGSYLLLIEQEYGKKDLGWEQFFHNPHRPGRLKDKNANVAGAWYLFWVFMMVISLAGDCLIYNVIESASWPSSSSAPVKPPSSRHQSAS